MARPGVGAAYGVVAGRFCRRFRRSRDDHGPPQPLQASDAPSLPSSRTARWTAISALRPRLGHLVLVFARTLTPSERRRFCHPVSIRHPEHSEGSRLRSPLAEILRCAQDDGYEDDRCLGGSTSQRAGQPEFLEPSHTNPPAKDVVRPACDLAQQRMTRFSIIRPKNPPAGRLQPIDQLRPRLHRTARPEPACPAISR